jgi:hypothetical protein
MADKTEEIREAIEEAEDEEDETTDGPEFLLTLDEEDDDE